MNIHNTKCTHIECFTIRNENILKIYTFKYNIILTQQTGDNKDNTVERLTTTYSYLT